MDRLRAQAHFVAAQQRLAEAQGKTCEYTEQLVEPGTCELMCHRFTNAEEVLSLPPEVNTKPDIKKTVFPAT